MMLRWLRFVWTAAAAAVSARVQSDPYVLCVRPNLIHAAGVCTGARIVRCERYGRELTAARSHARRSL